MRILYLFLAGFFLVSSAWADVSFEPLLNTVTLRLTAEQWVTTKSALVTVGVNASVNDIGLEKIQSTLLSKLNQISNKGEWHIVSFNRSLDQSGLERVQMSAQARLLASDLAGLRDKAKAISKPGETLTIDAVEFTPSEDELRDANISLRNNIYQQIKFELANLAKLYPDQKYYVHSVDFVGMMNAVRQPLALAVRADSMGVSNTTTSLSVGDKLQIAAMVVLASAPNSDVTKLVHN